ncbi:hypothetical protein WKV44_05110 [Spirochaetia bacterium 38H-sp]|uniref:Uncharacterized protein n=1 Tax=Rarispira pelagica TaxID=3141764 RepID=A0ABU9UB73_9SPIR
MLDKISIGLDIATSLSIIGAAISFLLSHGKSRKQKLAMYAVSNLKDFLRFVEERIEEFYDIGKELRENPTQNMLDNNILKTIFLLEKTERVLRSQIEIYFPLFSPDKDMANAFKPFYERLKDLLKDARAGRAKFISVIENTEKFFYELEISVAKQLKNILQKAQ